MPFQVHSIKTRVDISSNLSTFVQSAVAKTAETIAASSLLAKGASIGAATTTTNNATTTVSSLKRVFHDLVGGDEGLIRKRQQVLDAAQAAVKVVRKFNAARTAVKVVRKLRDAAAATALPSIDKLHDAVDVFSANVQDVADAARVKVGMLVSEAYVAPILNDLQANIAPITTRIQNVIEEHPDVVVPLVMGAVGIHLACKIGSHLCAKRTRETECAIKELCDEVRLELASDGKESVPSTNDDYHAVLDEQQQHPVFPDNDASIDQDDTQSELHQSDPAGDRPDHEYQYDTEEASSTGDHMEIEHEDALLGEHEEENDNDDARQETEEPEESQSSQRDLPENTHENNDSVAASSNIASPMVDRSENPLELLFAVALGQCLPSS